MSKFYKLPKELLCSGLTPRAILLYCILADRQELSNGNAKFKDKTGYYILYPIKDLCNILGVGERQTMYALAELEDFAMIRRKKQGKGKPQKIYVQEVQNTAPQEVQNTAPQEVQNTAPLNNYTDNNKTYISSSSSAHSAHSAPEHQTEEEEEEEKPKDLKSLIKKLSQDMGYELTAKDINEIQYAVSKKKSDICNLIGYLKTCIVNQSYKATAPRSSYDPVYDIEEFEGMNDALSDEDW